MARCYSVDSANRAGMVKRIPRIRPIPRVIAPIEISGTAGSEKAQCGTSLGSNFQYRKPDRNSTIAVPRVARGFTFAMATPIAAENVSTRTTIKYESTWGIPFAWLK